MKRLVWLLLLVCTAAFARVQPVELPVDSEPCCCCENTGTCGMLDCAPPSAPSQTVVTLDAAQRKVVQKKSAQPADAETSKFYAPYLTVTPPESASFAKDEPTFPTAPPLRVTQCQWLI